MNLDPTQPGLDDDLTAEGLSPDLADSLALEALTAAEATRPDVAEASIHDESDPMVGRRLGAYRLMARLGGGEAASVYLADRVEGLERRVAVRLIHRASDGAAIVGRFRDEIPLHAALGQHPSIAGLIDAGTDDDGRPYFVVEYVDGPAIDRYCDENRLTVEDRVRLFAQVCDAVQFAHRHAVLHRDLKPGKILVDADGVPKLIDLGLAHLIDPRAVGPGAAIATPEYASPELVLGQPLTTASDLYAMGVVLYRLLTGRGPYRLKSGEAAEVLQAICEQAPERPSTAVVPRRRRPAKAGVPEPAAADDPDATAPPPPPEPTIPAPSPDEIASARGTTPGRLRRALAGDLDAIVLMAMRQEPERRYASAEQLAEDLRAHLAGRPVRARGDSTFYRARTFVRRNAAAIAAVAAVLLAMAAGIAGTTRGLILARRDRDRAADASREAREAVDRLFTRVVEERALARPGMQATRNELLQDAAAFYERSLADRPDDPATLVERASARSRLARIAAEIGPPAAADEPHRRAIAAWDEVLRIHPDRPEYREELARALLGHADVLVRIKGREGEALEECRRALALVEAALAADRSSFARRDLLARVLARAARIRFDQGHTDEAVETLQRLLASQETLAAQYPSSIAARTLLARAHGLMGDVQATQPDGTAPSAASYERAVEILEAVIKEQPELADQAYALALDLGNLSLARQMTGRLDSALESGRRSVALLEALDRQYPGVLDYRQALAQAYNLLSDAHRNRNEPADALAIAEKARGLLERLTKEHPEDAGARIDLARSLTNMGRIQQQSGDPAEALRSFRRAVDLLEGLPELGPRDNYILACDLALCLPLIGAKPGSQGVEDEEALSPGDKLRRKVYGDRAIEVLRKAIRGGSIDVEILQSDPDLAALRGREDFRRIVEDIEKQAADGKSRG